MRSAGPTAGTVSAMSMRSRKGPGEARLVLRDATLVGLAAAGVAGIVRVAAAARVHGGDELEAGRVDHASVGAGDGDLAGFQRLAQTVEHLRLELGQFIKEQHPVVGERHLAGAGVDAAAHQRSHGGGMMRGAEGPPVGERALGEKARHGVHHRHLEQLRRAQRRQDGRQAGRQHRLAGPRRSAEKEVVAAGCGDLQRALRRLSCPRTSRRSGIAPEAMRMAGAGAESTCTPAHMIGELDERARRDDPHVAGRPGGFRPALVRADEAMTTPARRDRRGQHAGHRRDRAVEGELAEHGHAIEAIGGNRADGGHDAECDRQVEVAALLGQVGGGEVDDNPARGSASPEATRAAFTRSRDSPTALSGRPTSTKATAPG